MSDEAETRENARRGEALVRKRRRASVVCVDGGELLCVRLRDPLTAVARLFVPGGGVEPAETPVAAAEREALEETGYRVRVEPASERVACYLFTWAGHEVECTTHFFRATLRGDRAAPEPVHDDPVNEGAVWLPLEQLNAQLGYDAALLAAVEALLD